MAKPSKNKIIGIILFVCAVILLLPFSLIPFMDEAMIAKIAILCCGVYLLVIK